MFMDNLIDNLERTQCFRSIKRDRSDSDDSLSLIEESIYDDAENVKNQLSQLRLEGKHLF